MDQKITAKEAWLQSMTHLKLSYLFYDFNRATLCVRAVFAVVRCPSVCLSVCLSVRLSVRLSVCLSVCLSVWHVGVLSKRLIEDIVKLLYRPGRPIILVIWPPAPISNSKGNPFSGGAKYTGVGKICDFGLKSPFICGTVRDSLWLLWNVNRKSQAADRSVSIPMRLSDP